MHHHDPLHPLHHGPVHHSILHHGILHHKLALFVAAGLIVVGIVTLFAFSGHKTKASGPVPASVSISTWLLHMTATLADMPVQNIDQPF